MSVLVQAELRFDWAAYVKQKGGVRAIHGKANEYLFGCPDCGKLKLAVNTGRRAWQCFVCGDGGLDATSLVAKVEQLPWRDAIVVVLTGAQEAVGRIDQIKEQVEPDARARIWIPPAIPHPESWEPVGLRSRAGMMGAAYCHERGIAERVATEMKLAVCTRGRFANRLMFPVHDSGGRLIFYQGRAMWKPRPYERHIKILSPRQEGDQAGPADCLLNLHYLVGQGMGKRVLVVEGPVDCAHAWPDAVALFGKRISPRQIELLKRAGVQELDLGLDPDAADQMLKVAPVLADLFVLRLVQWPAGHDPGSLTKEQIEHYRAGSIIWQGGRLQQLGMQIT